MPETTEPPTIAWNRKYLVTGVAMLLVAATWATSRYPDATPDERRALASRFSFERIDLPALAPPESFKHVRKVAPDLDRISAWISSLGAAVSLSDLDGDGLANDVCAVDPRTDQVSVYPAPGTPERYEPFVLDPAPLPFDASTTAPMGTRVGDFNEDGAADVIVYYWGRTPILFLQTAGSQPASPARDRFAAVELTDNGERWFTNALTQADLDGDGHVDLIVGNYFKDGARILDPSAADRQSMHEGKASARNGGRNRFFLWKGPPGGEHGPSGFVEIPDVVTDEIAHAWTLAAGAVDLNHDQLPEIYFANDFGPDWLLLNESTPGTLRFKPLTGTREFTKPKSCVLGDDSFKGMGCDFADVNRDGLPDIYVSNIATRFGLTESHFLWMSTGELERMADGHAPYVQESESEGLSRSGWGWDCRLADFDNDGELEAVQACGFVKGTINRWPELQSLGTSNDAIVSNPKLWPTFRPGADLSGHDANPFFVRGADGRFHDIASELGLSEPMVSKGIAIADVDGDGRLDYAVANQWQDSCLFLNRSPGAGRSVVFSVLVPAGHEATGAPPVAGGVFESFGALGGIPVRPAIGAAVEVELPNGTTRVGHVDGGSGHSGQRSPEVHFGLGPAESADAAPVEVRVTWRDRTGRVRRWPGEGAAPALVLPGRHWILLGDAPAPAISATRITTTSTPTAP